MLYAALAMSLVLQSPVESPAKVKTNAEHIVKRMATRLHLKPGEEPKVVVKFYPSLSSYYVKPNTLFTGSWDQCPEPVQAFMNKWAGLTDGQMDGKTFFREMFSWYLIAHELGHFVQGRAGKLTKDQDALKSELYANQFAVAFWMEEKGGKARLEKLFKALLTIQPKLKSPVPAGEEEGPYLYKHYEELSTDPDAYGWYQLKLCKQAWEERSKHSFAELLKHVE